MRLIIISNRLPVKANREENGKIEFQRSEGGLATGLGSLETSIEKHWIGWSGVYAKNKQEEVLIKKELIKDNYHPVFLNQAHIENYYEGYSNKIIWPLCHYFFSNIEYEHDYWTYYQEANALFAKTALEIIKPGDVVWIHDYQLMLLPQKIRAKTKNVSIGYFHHIPFPSYELFRLLPERADVLNGLFGADLIAFHTHDYMRHFISSSYGVLDLDFNLDEVQVDNRVVHVDTFPMGINYEFYNEAILSKEVQEIADNFKEDFGDVKIILSVDRLDYSKGILHRLKAFAQFLEHNPSYSEKVILAMLVVPSRDNVEIYADLKNKIDEAIGAINGTYSTPNWSPIHYFYRAFPLEELLAMYYISDIALVTSLRDGMNLVAKEYVATKRDTAGVLILSELAGASIELQEAVSINPNDINDIEKAILEALEMKESEQLSRMKAMQAVIAKQTISKWTKDFFKELTQIKQQTVDLQNKIILLKDREQIKEAYQKAKKRLILLDYDGTLVSFKKRPQDASPTKEVLSLLKELASDKKNKVVISSGRDYSTLDRWLGDLPIDFAAEHGAYYKIDSVWHNNIKEPLWDEELMGILQNTTQKTPKSRIEMKKTAIVWHYRNVDAWLAELRVKQLVNQLMNPCARLNLQIMKGNKIIEIKSPDFSKGTEVKRLLEKQDYDFILAIGDDVTDDDMFHALPEKAISIKIGDFSEYAKYNLPTQKQTIPFLKQLIE